MIKSVVSCVVAATAAFAANAAVDPMEVTVPKAHTNAAGKVLLCRMVGPAKEEPDKKYPLVVFMHGAVSRSRDMVSAFWAVGGNIRYREYPDLMHWCWDKTYSDNQVMKWLFSQRKE